ncbi:hypothetical protein [Agaribacterium haliotis]|uniref:hypothetical protein n=1 Tax=Agaribacterium haliotis TaxID=2013869 RepID=UPI000BB587C2|nr:hypothetical protein [Agaribacterium haliotis]
MDYRDDEVLVMTSSTDIEKLTECLLDLNLSVMSLQKMIKSLAQQQDGSFQEDIENRLDAEFAAQLSFKKVLH